MTVEAAEVELRCPLCGYDVRGLPEPRCPECGHRFEWEELADEARRRHRYLFEHHFGPGGYLRTRFALGLPWRFWRELRPAHRLRPWRALALGLAGMAALLVAWAWLAMSRSLHDAWRQQQWWATATYPVYQYPSGAISASPPVAGGGPYVTRFAPASTLFARPPGVGSWKTWYEAWRLTRSYGHWFRLDLGPMADGMIPGTGPRSGLAFALGGWVASAIALAVMRQTFARARVLPGHAARVWAYAADVMPMAIVTAALAVTVALRGGLWVAVPSDVWRWLELWGVVTFGWTLLQLAVAGRLYLGLPVGKVLRVVLATAVMGLLIAEFVMVGTR